MAGVLRYFTGHSDHQLEITDFVNYKKTGRLGFPREPICSSYDPELGVYYIGTREGLIHVYVWDEKESKIEQEIMNVKSGNEINNEITNDAKANFKNGKDLMNSKSNKQCSMANDYLGRLSSVQFVNEIRKKVVRKENEEDGLGGGNIHLIGSLPEGKVKRYPLRIHAIHGKGQLMILANDFDVFKLKIQGAMILFDHLELAEQDMKITTTSILQGNDKSRFLLGTSLGRVYAVESKKLDLEMLINYVGPSTGESEVPGSRTVLGLATHSSGKKVYVLYNDNRLVIHDASINETIETIILGGDVKPTGINIGSNNTLLVSYEDGTYKRLEESGNFKSYQVWGPYPCDPIVKITEASVNRTANPILIFSGGMPTASFGDRFTITLKTEKNLLVLDFPTKILDFHISQSPIYLRADKTKYDSVLIVLTEHEMVMVDIRDSGWRTLPPQLYFPMDAHALTSSFFAANVSQEVWSKMLSMSQQWWKGQNYSEASNPLFAHLSDEAEKHSLEDPHRRQILLTGHENGSVNVFTCGEKSSSLLFVVNVSDEFEVPQERERTLSVESDACTWNTDEDDEPGSLAVPKDQDEWPPFRKVGLYDQYSDEPGVAVLKLCMDPNSGQFAVSTKCGANFVYDLQETSRTLKPSLTTIPLIKDPQYQPPKPTPQEAMRDPNRALPPRGVDKTYPPGYQPCTAKEATSSLFLQLDPRTSCTTMAILSSRKMLALANEFGFAIFNYAKGEVMLSESYIASEDLMSAVGENMRSLYKSMKKSVRNTFRRKSRSNNKKDRAAAVGDTVLLADEDADDESNYRAVERQIEARETLAPGKTKPHLVKFVCFLRTPISDGTDLTDTFWVGLNSGHIYSYAIEDRPRQSDELRLDKEIRLSHTAPVIHMGVFMEISSKHALHRLLIVTEEQMRLYALPSMKRLKYKVKLTSTEGLQIRKAIVATVHSASKPMNKAPWILILTNTGEVRVYSTQNSKIKARFQVVHHQNHIAIASAILTPFGDILYLRGQQSEFQKATISSHSTKWKEPFADTEWPRGQISPSGENTPTEE